MDADGQIYFGADGDIPEEDKKRLDKALVKEQANRERLREEMAADIEANLDEYKKKFDLD